MEGHEHGHRAVYRGGNAQIMHTLYHTVRALARKPLFSTTVILLLGLGVGLSASTFTFIKAVLTPPFPDADHLVWVREEQRAANGLLSPAEFKTLQSSTSTWGRVAGYSEFTGADFLTLNSRLTPIGIASVTPDFTTILGGDIVLGHAFNDQEATKLAAHPVLISSDLWHRAFSGRPAVINKVIKINGFPYTVMGVMGPRFRFPLGVDVWTLFNLDLPYLQNNHRLNVIGHINANIDQSSSAIVRMSSRITGDDTTRLQLVPFLDGIIRPIRLMLRLALLLAGSILAIATVNVLVLITMRGQRRSREIAIRSALGASMTRLGFELLSESLTLVFASAMLAAGIGLATFRILDRWATINIPLSVHIGMTSFAAFLGLASLGVVVVLLSVSTIHATRPDLMRTLVSGGTMSANSRSRATLSVLIALEITTTTLLLFVSTMSVRTFVQLRNSPLGFDPHELKYFSLYLQNPRSMWSKQFLVGTAETFAQRLTQQPGILSVGASMRDILAPQSGQVEVRSAFGGVRRVDINGVTPGYFQSTGLGIDNGTDFVASDLNTGNVTVIVDATTARVLWPGRNPVGQTIYFGATDTTGALVRGVTHDIDLYGVKQPTIYLPATDSVADEAPFLLMHVYLRTPLSPDTLRREIGNALQGIPTQAASSEVMPLDSQVSLGLTTEKLQSMISMVVALITGFLAAVGLYSVTAFWVLVQKRAIAVRVALGATTGRVYSGIVGGLTILCFVGVILGAGIGIGLTRTLLASGEAYSKFQPNAVLIAIGVALLVSMIIVPSSLLPIRRALRIPPSEALRAE